MSTTTPLEGPSERPVPDEDTGAASTEKTASHLHRPILWGVVVGGLQAASPLAFWWLQPATVHGMAIAFIAAVYIGFAVADGRRRVLVAETAVAAAFVVVAAVGVVASAWLLVVGYAGHGLKDMWQERHHYVANTRWWPPFCAAVDLLVAAVVIGEIAAGITFHG